MGRKRKFRVAIVGCGRIAGGYDMPRARSRGKIRTHIKAYLADRRFKVVAACDTNFARLKRFCAHWNVPNAYKNLESMLAREKPDVVSVCAPISAHRKILETIARHPVRLVFAEKPFTASSRDARLVLKKLKARKISVAVNYLRRWCPNHRKLKQIIESGRLGRLRSLDAVYSGDLLNIGSHLIDLVLYFAGDIASVSCEELVLGSRARGFLERSPRDRFVLEMLFDRGLIRISRYGYAGECLVWRGNSARVLFRFASPGRGIDSAMRHAIDNLAAHLSHRAALASDAKSALRVLSVCEALKRSSRTGRKTAV